MKILQVIPVFSDVFGGPVTAVRAISKELAKRHDVSIYDDSLRFKPAHDSLPRIMAKQRLKLIYNSFFGYKLLSAASKVIALGQIEAEQYRSMSVPKEKIEIIPNEIDLSKYAKLPPKGSFKMFF